MRPACSVPGGSLAAPLTQRDLGRRLQRAPDCAAVAFRSFSPHLPDKTHLMRCQKQSMPALCHCLPCRRCRTRWSTGQGTPRSCLARSTANGRQRVGQFSAPPNRPVRRPRGGPRRDARRRAAPQEDIGQRPWRCRQAPRPFHHDERRRGRRVDRVAQIKAASRPAFAAAFSYLNWRQPLATVSRSDGTTLPFV